MTTELIDRIGQAYAQGVDPGRLATGLRDAQLVVPMVSPTEAVSVSERGLSWICAFTSLEALATFATARGEGDREWVYRTIRGSDLLYQGLGVAVDLGCTRPMLFPVGAA